MALESFELEASDYGLVVQRRSVITFPVYTSTTETLVEVIQMRIWLVCGDFSLEQFMTWARHLNAGTPTTIPGIFSVGTFSEHQWPEMCNHLQAGCGLITFQEYRNMRLAIDQVLEGFPRLADDILRSSGMLP